jgi:hypothetical protein
MLDDSHWVFPPNYNLCSTLCFRVDKVRIAGAKQNTGMLFGNKPYRPWHLVVEIARAACRPKIVRQFGSLIGKFTRLGIRCPRSWETP